jgi:RNA polymerase sigma factor (sigma-70 family)
VSSSSSSVESDTISLVAGIVEGNAQAWAEVVDRYEPMIMSTARSFRLQEADARDVTQTTWLRLSQHASRLHTPGHLAGWLTRVAKRESLAVLRSHRCFGDPEPLESLTDPAPGPEQAALTEDTCRRVRAAVERLPHRPRTVVEALFGDDPAPYTELSTRSGVPIGSIGPTRQRAVLRLRRDLAEATG